MTIALTADSLFTAAIFAARKHQGQARKDAAASPYVTHPLSVARILWQIGGVREVPTLVAAILHDTLEDTATTESELAQQFGKAVLETVLEVTDDKSLPKMERKRLQVLHAPELSQPARLIKLGDKWVNCEDILTSPPQGWPLIRRQHYIQWAADVILQLRGTNPGLEAAFDALLEKAQAELQFTLQPLSTVNQHPWAPHPANPVS